MFLMIDNTVLQIEIVIFFFFLPFLDIVFTVFVYFYFFPFTLIDIHFANDQQIKINTTHMQGMYENTYE